MQIIQKVQSDLAAQAFEDQRAGISLTAGRANIKGAFAATAYLKGYIEAIRTDPRAIAASKANR